MLKSKKHVFWEALVMTIAVFVIGLFVGMMIEAGNSNKISQLYISSEISLVDGLAYSRISNINKTECERLKELNIKFADKIYEEAKLLERYEDSGKLTDTMELLHKKYDLLRTLAWEGNIKSFEECSNYNLIVYLYDYNTEDIDKKARQNVWSKILSDVKERQENMILLPIAANQNLTSTDILLDQFNVEKLPALVINNQKVIYEVQNADSLIDSLD